jgi:glycosyltransferase involved in cell wall biosynthesis
MASRGLDLRKLHIVPNGISPDDWAAAPEALSPAVAAVLAQARAAGDAVVGYAGSMGLPNALDTLLDVAAQLRDAPIRFVWVGDGHERERLVARIRAEGLS